MNFPNLNETIILNARSDRELIKEFFEVLDKTGGTVTRVAFIAGVAPEAIANDLSKDRLAEKTRAVLVGYILEVTR